MYIVYYFIVSWNIIVHLHAGNIFYSFRYGISIMTHSQVAPSFKRKFRAMSPRVPVARDLRVAGA